MTIKDTPNHHHLEVAASRALEHISSSAHARSQPATPSANQSINSNINHTDILDIFMSPDKPKSRLRQLAETSAKKYSNRSSLPVKPINHDHSSPPGFFLNLGIPTKPPVDPKAFAFKPPRNRSLGPRRSSIVSRKSLSPTKSPKTSIENLLDDLDILDHPKPSDNPSDQKASRNSDPKIKLNKTNVKLRYDNPSGPSATRKSRRVTVVHLTTQQTNLDTIQDSREDPPVPNTHTERVECDTSDQCDILDSQVSDGDSTCSDDSFDPNVLLMAPSNTKDAKIEISDATIKLEEEEDQDSIIVHPKRSSRRNQSRVNSKRVIPQSDSEIEDENQPSTSSSKPPLTSNSCLLTDRPHPRKTSLKANHSKQKSSQPTLIRVDGDSSDDSIEILPSRALQFQKSRALALSTLINNPPDCKLGDQSAPAAIKITSEYNHIEAAITSQGEIKVATKDSFKPMIPDAHKPFDPMDHEIKKPSKSSDKTHTKPAVPKPEKKAASTKKTTGLLKKPIAFSKIRDDLAEELIESLDAKVFNRQLPSELELVWSKRLNTTAGRAKWTIIKDPKGNILREKVQIELGTKVIDDETKLRNTLAHELCHVACWFIDRQKDEKHGKYFKAWARKINGVMPDVKVTTKHDYVISYKFNWGCNQPGCTKVYGRHSNSIDPERHACTCGGRLVRIPKATQKAGVDPAAASKTNDTAGNPDHNLISVDGELTGRLEGLKIIKDLID